MTNDLIRRYDARLVALEYISETWLRNQVTDAIAAIPAADLHRTDLDAANARADAADAERDRIVAEWAETSQRNYQRAKAAEDERDRLRQWWETAIVERDAYSEERDAAEAQAKTLREALDEISTVVGCLEGKDALDRELIRNIKASLALTPPKEPS